MYPLDIASNIPTIVIAIFFIPHNTVNTLETWSHIGGGGGCMKLLNLDWAIFRNSAVREEGFIDQPEDLISRKFFDFDVWHNGVYWWARTLCV